MMGMYKACFGNPVEGDNRAPEMAVIGEGRSEVGQMLCCPMGVYCVQNWSTTIGRVLDTNYNGGMVGLYVCTINALMIRLAEVPLWREAGSHWQGHCAHMGVLMNS